MKFILLLAFVFLGALIAAILGYWLLYYKQGKLLVFPLLRFGTQINFDRLVSGFNVLLTLISLYVAYRSLVIAQIAFNDAKESGPKQQAILEESRKALESVVNSSRIQQDLINQNLIVSTQQLSTLKQQWQDEQERLAQRPNFSLTVIKLSEENFKDKPITLELDENRWARLPLAIKNVGNASAINTTIFCLAEPKEVILYNSKMSNISYPNDYNGLYPNSFTYRGFSSMDIPPYDIIGLPYTWSLCIQVPKGVDKFSILLKIFSSKSKEHSVKVDFVVKQ